MWRCYPPANCKISCCERVLCTYTHPQRCIVAHFFVSCFERGFASTFLSTAGRSAFAILHVRCCCFLRTLGHPVRFTYVQSLLRKLREVPFL